ncbi:uncharacterized protein LOC144927401 [Branchiostoma floridae x Branchiostoma belcheri]
MQSLHAPLPHVQVHGSRDTYYVHSTSEDTSGRCTCTVLAPSPDVCSDDAKYHYIKDLEAQVANLTTLVHQLANRTSSALDIQMTMTLIHNLTSQLAVLEADRQLLLTEYFSNIRDEIQALAGLLPQLQADSADALLLQVYHTQLSNLSDVLSNLQEQHGLSVSDLQLQIMQLTEQLNNCNVSKETTTTEEPTTMMTPTTAKHTTPHPTPVVGWGNGQSVHINSITYSDGVTGYINNGWKVDATIDEKISNASAHQGQQCWYYKSGTNTYYNPGPGDKTPFSPGLSVKVGRSDGSYTAEADSFYVSFWFKMAKDYSYRFGDGTKMLVVAGDPSGTGASSNHLEIYFPINYRAKLSIRTKESYPSYAECAQPGANCSDNFGSIYNTIADTLDPTTWHHVEMTLRSRPQDYMDEWFYVIDGDTANQKQEGAFYKTQQYDEGRYLYVNRVSFVDISSVSDSTKKGIYFDDITYKAYNSANPNVVLDEYSTSFEPVEN